MAIALTSWTTALTTSERPDKLAAASAAGFDPTNGFTPEIHKHASEGESTTRQRVWSGLHENGARTH